MIASATTHPVGEIIAHLAWNEPAPPGAEAETVPASGEWGFLICRNIHGALSATLYGTIGPISDPVTHSVQTAVLLNGAPDKPEALPHILSRFALACGLMIIGQIGLELGDTLIVAGTNPLAHSILAAGRVQGANTVCLIPAGINAPPAITTQAACTIALQNITTVDARLDDCIAASHGRAAFADAAGDVALVQAMAARVRRMERLIFCRPETTQSAMLNIRDIHHRRSAEYHYWAGPATPEDGLALQRTYERAGRLMQWGRLCASYS